VSRAGSGAPGATVTCVKAPLRRAVQSGPQNATPRVCLYSQRMVTYFFALAISSSMTFLKASYDAAPGTKRPLMKVEGVAVAPMPMASAVCESIDFL
jgi:hypothetical protein